MLEAPVGSAHVTRSDQWAICKEAHQSCSLLLTRFLAVAFSWCVTRQSVFNRSLAGAVLSTLGAHIASYIPLRGLVENACAAETSALAERRGEKNRGSWHLIIMEWSQDFPFLLLAAPLLIVIPLSLSSGQYLRIPPPAFPCSGTSVSW